MISLEERLEGGLLGLLIGDALGVPYEFHSAAAIPPLADIEYNPPKGFRRSHDRIEPGTWSDDGAQALVLLASLLRCKKMNVEDFAQGLVDWYEKGYMAVDNIVFDVGIQTGQAINRIKAKIPPSRSGGADERANGNGSLMRVLPLALWHKGSDEDLVFDAHTQSKVTHAHPRSQVCCALYCLWARYILKESKHPWEDAIDKLVDIYGEESKEYEELEWSVRPRNISEGQGSGYVVDCLRSARWLMDVGSYEQVVKTAISLGNDTDTTACVAGGIAGLRDGIKAIPSRWIEGLRGRELHHPLLQQLLEWRT